MGLEEFDVAPDNEGGRPKGSKENTSDNTSFGGAKRSHGEPYTPAVDGDTEWWQEQIDAVVGTSFLSDEDDSDFSDDYLERKKELRQLADRLHINTIDLRVKLEEEGLLEVDWEEFAEKEYDGSVSARVPGHGSKSSSSSSSGRFGSSSASPSDGLASLVDNAK